VFKENVCCQARDFASPFHETTLTTVRRCHATVIILSTYALVLVSSHRTLHRTTTTSS
jgi:hypothetical protein